MYSSRFRRRHHVGFGGGGFGRRRRNPRHSLLRYLRRRNSDPDTYSARSSNRFYRHGPPRRRPFLWERYVVPKPPKDEPEPELEDSPELPEADVEELAKVLHVKSIDLCISENTVAHRTDKYDIVKEREEMKDDKPTGKMLEPELVLRRGQDFNLSIEFDRPYHKDKNDLELVFKTGKNPRPKDDRLMTVKVEESGKRNEDPSNWSARLVGSKGNTVNLIVYSSADAVIGEWSLRVKTKEKVKTSDVIEKLAYDHPDGIYIILNPWCKDDVCYMSTTDLLKEYVLNDSGCIFTGNSSQLSVKLWNFAQFEEEVLDLSLQLGLMSGVDMSDPVKIARGISALVNNADDNGVLVGNWSGDYKGGVRPTTWAGSYKILKQYKETGVPVKFGQCWVFSGVTTTVCRALGLPCRSVTNFSSAHDTDGSVTIDKYSRDGEDGYSPDSVWNFHVWNEVWMDRIDLPEGYGGWQVIDATPQETSEDIFCCGPSPLAAIKRGEIMVPHDTPFIFAEVNADRVYWNYNDMDEYIVESVVTDSIGIHISTKTPTGLPYKGPLGASLYWYRNAVDDPDRQDITHLYKYPEGTTEERKAVLAAVKATKQGHRNIYASHKKEDVKIEVRTKDDVLLGDDFTIGVQCFNNDATEIRTIEVQLSVKSVTYTGRPLASLCKKTLKDKQLKPGEKYMMEAPLGAKDYVGKLTDQDAMDIYVHVFVKETGQIYAANTDYRLRRPALKVEIVPKKCKLGESVEAIVSFTNPLPMPLTECFLAVEGPGFKIDMIIPCIDVPGKQEFNKKVVLTPKKRGSSVIMADFDAKQIINVTGYASLEVTKE
ncbi:hypothetical protein ScPMuIL_001795 [Solemya velum]